MFNNKECVLDFQILDLCVILIFFVIFGIKIINFFMISEYFIWFLNWIEVFIIMWLIYWAQLELFWEYPFNSTPFLPMGIAVTGNCLISHKLPGKQFNLPAKRMHVSFFHKMVTTLKKVPWNHCFQLVLTNLLQQMCVVLSYSVSVWRSI